MLTAQDRIGIRRTLQEARQDTRRNEGVVLNMPLTITCPHCQGLEAACAICRGVGTITQHSKYISYARVTWPKLTDYIVSLAASYEVGDAILYVREEEKGQYEQIQGRGFLTIDGDRYGIKTISPAGVGRKDEYVIVCERQTQ